jgi:hypothetical protein
MSRNISTDYILLTLGFQQQTVNVTQACTSASSFRNRATSLMWLLRWYHSVIEMSLSTRCTDVKATTCSDCRRLEMTEITCRWVRARVLQIPSGPGLGLREYVSTAMSLAGVGVKAWANVHTFGKTRRSSQLIRLITNDLAIALFTSRLFHRSCK